MNVLRIINTLLLACILGTLVLIFLYLRHPIKVSEPVAIQGWGSPGALLHTLGREPVRVTIEEQPIQVEITR
jgi:hypothetical protein